MNTHTINCFVWMTFSVPLVTVRNGDFSISGTTEQSFLLLFLMFNKGQQFHLGTVKMLFELKIWVLFLCWHAINLLDPFWLFIQFHKGSMFMEILQQCYIWFITVQTFPVVKLMEKAVIRWWGSSPCAWDIRQWVGRDQWPETDHRGTCVSGGSAWRDLHMCILWVCMSVCDY